MKYEDVVTDTLVEYNAEITAHAKEIKFIYINF